MYWHDRHEVIEELQTILTALGSIRPDHSMSKFDQRYYRNRKIIIAAVKRNPFQHLPGILA